MNSRFAQRDDKISGYESTDYLSQLEYNCEKTAKLIYWVMVSLLGNGSV